MRAFQLLCLSLVVVASVSGEAGTAGTEITKDKGAPGTDITKDKDAAGTEITKDKGAPGTKAPATTTKPMDGAAGFCSGAHKDCEKYGQDACLSEKSLGCKWNEPVTRPVDTTKPTEPVADGKRPVDTTKPTEPASEVNATSLPGKTTRPVDTTKPTALPSASTPTKSKSECVRMRPSRE